MLCKMPYVFHVDTAPVISKEDFIILKLPVSSIIIRYVQRIHVSLMYFLINNEQFSSQIF